MVLIMLLILIEKKSQNKGHEIADLLSNTNVKQGESRKTTRQSRNLCGAQKNLWSCDIERERDTHTHTLADPSW